MRILFTILTMFFAALTSVQATIIQVTIDGTVSDGGIGAGNDFTGVFGTPGSLIGKAFVAEFLFDTDKGTRTVGFGLDQTIGGNYNGTISPSLGATLTINGLSAQFAGDYQGWASLAAFNGQANFVASDFINVGGFQNFGSMKISLLSTTLPNSLDQLFFSSTAPGPFSSLFTVWNGFGGPQNLANGVLLAETVRVSTPPPMTPIPADEPASLSLVLFGLATLFVKRRQLPTNGTN